MKKQFLTGLLAMALSAGAIAGEVTGYTDATSGSAATAADINANFNALISAINDNNQRITALEEQAAGINTAEGTYNFVEIAVELGGAPGTGFFDGYSQIGTWSSTGSFTFLSDGTFSGTINETFSILFDTTLCDSTQQQCRQAYQPDFSQTATENLGGTWTEDGNSVIATFPEGGSVTFTKAGPRLMVLQEKSIEGGDATNPDLFDFTNLVLLIKQVN
ncbi:hypothetical protein [Marinobacter confluentis]|uniref:Uncharacterized protein n=1 Tax=Marinobacter confluentis TaxID=1697557 RepID=A0A4Z1BDX5_9GAMM|nr:hypothetical protein [Marinobacter confluentis]TGN40524.1 hypothetical protein E5Q11_09685 [Marinobacter confluentis]